MRTINNIIQQVYEAKSNCLRNGFDPTEVWIGPEEAEILRGMGYGNLTELALAGLSVRLSKFDGVRAGITFES